METLNILGISFSTRLLGLSVMKSHHLVEYSIKLYKEEWTPLKCDRIRQALIACIEDYTISDIVLSIPPHHHQTEGYELIYECIISLAKEKNIPTWEYSYKKLPEVCIDGEKTDKKGIMRSLAHFYPELYQYYLKERRNKKKYYTKLFEAIGVSLLYYRTLIHKKR